MMHSRSIEAQTAQHRNLLTASTRTALRIAADAAFAGRIERVSLRRLA